MDRRPYPNAARGDVSNCAMGVVFFARTLISTFPHAEQLSTDALYNGVLYSALLYSI